MILLFPNEWHTYELDKSSGWFEYWVEFVSIGWVDTPRFPKKGIKDTVHHQNTPESFATLLSKAKEYAERHPGQTKLITINAWNE